MKVAIVCDWLVVYAGAERVVGRTARPLARDQVEHLLHEASAERLCLVVGRARDRVGQQHRERRADDLGELDGQAAELVDFAARLEASGELGGADAVAPDGTWVRFGGEGKPPVVDGPFAETKDLIAGWMILDVDSYERAVELAAEMSAAPGPGGEPIFEWLELRPFLSEPPTVTE